MMTNKSYIILSPEYEEIYEFRFGRQPKYIPTDFVSNFGLTEKVRMINDFSRKWAKNPKYKKSS